MKKVLYISPSFDIKSGGGQLSKNLLSILKSNYDVIEYWIKNSNPLLSKIGGALCLCSHGLTLNHINKIRVLIKAYQFDIVFINHSYYGNLTKLIRNLGDEITIITFYHNIERIFLRNVCQRQRKIGNYLIYSIVKRNERLSSIYSDINICLNSRDSSDFKKYYGKDVSGIVPMFLEDSLNYQINREPNLPPKYGLFVGSLFFANYYGLLWFANNVSPYINTPIVVVGKGFESKRKEFEKYQNIIIIGTVNELAPYYKNANFIVSPVFDGSGMKTKTAEALMYGKSIIGTEESLMGYEIDCSPDIYLCKNQYDFISNINNYDGSKFSKINRDLFLHKYEKQVIERKLLNLIND